MIEKFLTTEQVANILQVHPFTILKLIKSGKLKGVKLGRVYRIKETDVKEFLERSTTKKPDREAEKKEEKKEVKEKNKPKEQIIFTDSKGEEDEKGKHYYLI